MGTSLTSTFGFTGKGLLTVLMLFFQLACYSQAKASPIDIDSLPHLDISELQSFFRSERRVLEKYIRDSDSDNIENKVRSKRRHVG